MDHPAQVAEKNELKLRVLAARDALQGFYDGVDNLSRSLEGKIMESCLHRAVLQAILWGPEELPVVWSHSPN